LLRDGTFLKPYKLNICSNFGGLGDHIARLPAIRKIHETYPHVSMNVYWHDYVIELVKLLLPEDDRIKHFKLSEMNQADESLPLIDFNPNRLTSLGLDLTLHAYLLLLDRLPDSIEDQRLPLAPLCIGPKPPSPYVVVTPCYTSRARAWEKQSIEEVMDWCIKSGLNVVVLGDRTSRAVGNGNQIEASNVEISLPTTAIDLREKTTLIEALAVIQGARAIVGVDNGLLYLAACTKTPRVRGMTTVRPEHRKAYGHGPLIDVVPPEREVDCRFCQSQVYFVKHDFRKCLYNDYKCTYSLTGQRFITALADLLS